MHCNTVQGIMQSPLPTAALQGRLAASLYHCNYTYEDVFFIQVCSDPPQMHCNTVQGKMQSPLLTAALHGRLAASLYHCNYTYEDLLFIQVCSDPTPKHCNTVLCKMQSPQLTAALQDRLAASLYHCNYTYEDVFFIQVCSDPDTKLIIVSSWLALKALCLSQERLPLREDDAELLCNAYHIKLMFVVDHRIKCSRERLPFHLQGKKAAVNVYIAATQCNILEGPFRGLSID